MCTRRLPPSGRKNRHGAIRALALVVLFLSCDNPVDVPNVGSVQIDVATTGHDVDLDGYQVVVSEVGMFPIGPNQTIHVPDVPAGQKVVSLTDVASNCTVDAGPQREIMVAHGGTSSVAFAVACVATGVLVSTQTTGVDFGAGYTVSLNGGEPVPIELTAELLLSRLTPGSYVVELDGVPANCTVDGDATRVVVVDVGQTVPVAFTVTCTAVTGVIEVSAVTSGIDVDSSGYAVQIDGGEPRPLALNGTVVFDGLTAGEYTIALVGNAANCGPDGANPRAASVSTGGATRDTAHVTFDVTCMAVTGSLSIATTTAGADFDLNGYLAHLPGWPATEVPVAGVVTIDRIPPGSYVLSLGDVASNCGVSGSADVPVTITAGGPARDTTHVQFSLTCAPADWIAFTRSSQDAAVVVASSTGADAAAVASGTEAAWSPDGRRIAYVRVACYYGWGGPYCGRVGVGVLDLEDKTDSALTMDYSDGDPVWAADGAHIFFTRIMGSRRTLFRAPANQGQAEEVPYDGGQLVGQPSVSPDGTLIAVTCDIDGNLDICTLPVSGGSLTRITNHPARDAAPRWSPDGTRIVFVTGRFSGSSEIAVMDPNGSNVVRVAADVVASRPSWSSDGTRLLFSRHVCDTYTGCTQLGLYAVGADGSALTQVTDRPDYAPAWRW